jgi:hypothetical protein
VVSRDGDEGRAIDRALALLRASVPADLARLRGEGSSALKAVDSCGDRQGGRRPRGHQSGRGWLCARNEPARTVRRLSAAAHQEMTLIANSLRSEWPALNG